MRWRRRTTRADGAPPDDGGTGELEQVQQAMEELETAKRAARARTSEISRIARTLRTLTIENHFAPMVRDALRGEFK